MLILGVDEKSEEEILFIGLKIKILIIRFLKLFFILKVIQL